MVAGFIALLTYCCILPKPRKPRGFMKPRKKFATVSDRLDLGQEKSYSQWDFFMGKQRVSLE